ncbi:MAG: hypothetical protein LBD37_09440 [Treponema sp.]|nr:hypothetical protein [Treponema sp.]
MSNQIQVPVGTKITLAVSPNNGYCLDKNGILANGKPIHAVGPDDMPLAGGVPKGAGTASFVMPHADTVISARFVPITNTTIGGTLQAAAVYKEIKGINNGPVTKTYPKTVNVTANAGLGGTSILAYTEKSSSWTLTIPDHTVVSAINVTFSNEQNERFGSPFTITIPDQKGLENLTITSRRVTVTRHRETNQSILVYASTKRPRSAYLTELVHDEPASTYRGTDIGRPDTDFPVSYLFLIPEDEAAPLWYYVVQSNGEAQGVYVTKSSSAEGQTALDLAAMTHFLLPPRN